MKRRDPRPAAIVAISLCVWSGSAVGARDDLSAIQRALSFLLREQVRTPVELVTDGTGILDFYGNWRQFFTLTGAEDFRVREVSPFQVAFIHHALSHIVERNRGILGLDSLDLMSARLMRKRAVGFLKAFQSPPGAPDAGTFAFWPYDLDPNVPDAFTTLALTEWLRGPILGGQRVPINLPFYPSTLAIPSDADVTATTYASLLDDALVDEGAGTSLRFERFFADWRDLGIVPRRLNPPWLPAATGAFLTWLNYRETLLPLFPNDVDLVVNANVLYALGRYDRLAVPGVAAAVNLINQAAALGLHKGRLREISDYYPDNLAFQYAVSRAFYEGRVVWLAPAVVAFADDLESTALHRPDGSAYWDLGDRQLNTAFAVLTLLNANRQTPLVDRGIEYLLDEQGEAGGFDEATFFIGRTTGGPVFEFKSASFTTAIVLEAFARYALARCGDAPRISSAAVSLCE